MKQQDAHNLYVWHTSRTWPEYVNELYGDGYTIVKQPGFDDIQARPPAIPGCPHCSCGQLVLNDNGTYLCQACKRRGQWVRQGIRIVLR